MKFLPDEKDWNHIDKKWVCDMLYTLDQSAIKDMITKAMNERRKKIEQSQNMLVEMRPEFVEALKRCNSFDCKLIIYSDDVKLPKEKQCTY